MTDDISSEHDDHFMDAIGHDQNYDGGGNKTTKGLKSLDVNQNIIQYFIKESEKKDAVIEEIKKEKYALEKTLNSLPRIYKFSEVTDIWWSDWSVLFLDADATIIKLEILALRNAGHDIRAERYTIEEMKRIEQRTQGLSIREAVEKEGINYFPVGLVSNESLFTFAMRNKERIGR